MFVVRGGGVGNVDAVFVVGVERVVLVVFAVLVVELSEVFELLVLEVEESLFPRRRKYAPTPPPMSKTAMMAIIRGSLLVLRGAPY